MGSNSFGNIFKITTWGESHGRAVGVVIDGVPALIEIDEAEINAFLALRSPGNCDFCSSRKERDKAQILSGVFEGKTTGAPICILIANEDVKSEQYEKIKNILRPGHANYTYLEKYGIFDYQGGGRASARETVCRVAAGAVAAKILQQSAIKTVAYVKQIGNIEANFIPNTIDEITKERFCPDEKAFVSMVKLLEKTKKEKNSLGGIVEFRAENVPPGLGDPIYEKLNARLSFAMMSIPAALGFEIGTGFASATMRGSEHNDPFIKDADGKVQTATNNCGGILGGISNGMPVIGRVAFKPTSSIAKAQKTLTINPTCPLFSFNREVREARYCDLRGAKVKSNLGDEKSTVDCFSQPADMEKKGTSWVITGDETTLEMVQDGRHDVCVAIRAVPVVEAMLSIVLVDAMLENRCARI